MNKISAKIVADSVSPQGHRIISYILTYPRFIHSELMTHRLFSRNAASSRAIPFKKMVQMIKEDPFIPIAWQKDHKGMQGTEYIRPHTDGSCASISAWLEARDNAVQLASEMNADGVTKQLCNRLLEPFQWYTVLVTATEFDNFFELRCPKYINPFDEEYWSKKDYIENNDPEMCPKTDLDWIRLSTSGAEIHIQALAEAMWDAKNESTPKKLEAGEWHIPFGDKMDEEKVCIYGESINIRPKIAVARCARLSYMTFDGEINYEKDIILHDTLLSSRHASPFEHCSRTLTNEEYDNCGKMIPLEDGTIKFEKGWVDNFRGFKSYRRILNFS